jgi:hypothetical protein
LVKLGHVALDGSLSDLQYYDVAPVFAGSKYPFGSPQ